MKKNKGKLIVIDAIDGAGKTTQVKLLLKRLRQEKIKCYLTDFPQYEKSFFGAMVRQYLNGRFGEIDKTDPYLISLLYALDRHEAAGKMYKMLGQGRIIISDRYAPANKIHQACKIKNARKKKHFLDWLDKMEFGALGVPRPDLVLYLDVPPKIAMPMAKARKRRRDKHEVNIKHQLAAYEQGRQLVKKYARWQRVGCVKNGKLLPAKEIHERIWQCVKPYVKTMRI